MNFHDRQNLNFLLNASEETIREWYHAASEDDREYASELLAAYAQEIRRDSANLRAIVEMDMIEFELADGDFTQADAVLSKFRL